MTRATRRSQHGFNLLEILISLLVLSIGLLGLVGIQAAAQQAELESYQRAQAMVLMNDIVDRINTNRKSATCYAITTSATAGTPYLGTTTGGSHFDASGASCSTGSTTAQARAVLDLQLIDAMLQGATETSGGASIGAMIGARACIGFDTATQAYTVAIAWQGLNKTFSPASWPTGTNPAFARNCALDKYGDDAQRRVVWTTIMLASLT